VPGDNSGAGGIGSAGGDTSGSGAQARAGGANTTDQLRPSQLPNTGDSSNTASTAITVAALLIVCGVWLRKRA
jgi:LPXTG-motif cell wall-anchored protein